MQQPSSFWEFSQTYSNPRQIDFITPEMINSVHNSDTFTRGVFRTSKIKCFAQLHAISIFPVAL